MICKSCNYDLLPTIKNVGPHVGAYCSFCGKWIKWLDKTERQKYTDSSGQQYPAFTGKQELSFDSEVVYIDDVVRDDKIDLEKAKELIKQYELRIKSRLKKNCNEDDGDDGGVPW